MEATFKFYIWYYTGLGGLGGWFIFFLFALLAVVWVIYDSATKRIPAIGWRMAVILLTGLIFPSIIYRFTGFEIQESLNSLTEIIFYLGLLGGILPPTLAVGYFVTFRGMVGCINGHVYEVELGECPECAGADMGHMPFMPSVQAAYPPPTPGYSQRQSGSSYADATPMPPPKPKAQAWLAADNGRSYQLNRGETSIGRASRNDIRLTGDNTVGREHIKIIEQNGRFKLIDLGAKNGTYVNEHGVRGQLILEPDDEIRLGDKTILRFITSGR